MTTAPASPERGPARPAPDTPGGPAGSGRPVSEAPGCPDDADRDGDVDVLYLAGQRPAVPGGEWLLITAVTATPGAEFTARILPAGGRHARGGDVLVHLAAEPGGHLEPLTVRAGAWAVIAGHLIPVAIWTGNNQRAGPRRSASPSRSRWAS